MPGPARIASFVVSSERLSADELAARIGSDPDRGGVRAPRFPKQAFWEIVEAGPGTSDLSTLIDAVIDRVRPLAEGIGDVRAVDEDAVCLLRIVQYVGPDPVGPGFALESDAVRLLANLGAFVDADQYWVREPYQ